MAEEQNDTTEGTPTCPSDTLHFLDLVRQLAVNPTAGQSWEADTVRKLVVWILWESDLNKTKPERNRQDIFVLHCLLATRIFHIDELLRHPRNSVVETALSLAVENSDEELITFLLKMGASLDVLIGPVLSIGKPALFASDRACPMFASLILQHGEAPSRLPVNTTEGKIWEMENGMRDHSVFINELQSNNIVQLFDKGIEYEMAQMRANPEIIKTWTRIHRTFVYARMNQRRPRGPLESELVQMGHLLTYKGDISVDSYLIDELIERKTALFEALYRRNLMQVEWLLRVHHANPNQVCMTGQLLWNDDVMERFPIEHTLRGFLVSTEEDSALFGTMMDLLMDYGSTDLTQTTSLMRVLTDNVSLQLVCPELLHFMGMSDRIYDRTPAVFTEALRVEFNIGIPTILRVCERKWLEDVLWSSGGSQNLDDVLRALPVFLHRITPPDRFFLLPQSFQLLTAHRAYRSSMLESYCRIVDARLPDFEDFYNDSYESSAFPVEDVELIHRKRVLAFIKVLARLYPMNLEARNFLRKYYRLLILDPNALLPLSVYKLQNQCVSVVHQEVTAGRLKRSYIVACLPPMVYKEVVMSEGELLNVAAILPADT